MAILRFDPAQSRFVQSESGQRGGRDRRATDSAGPGLDDPYSCCLGRRRGVTPANVAHQLFLRLRQRAAIHGVRLECPVNLGDNHSTGDRGAELLAEHHYGHRHYATGHRRPDSRHADPDPDDDDRPDQRAQRGRRPHRRFPIYQGVLPAGRDGRCRPPAIPNPSTTTLPVNYHDESPDDHADNLVRPGQAAIRHVLLGVPAAPRQSVRPGQRDQSHGRGRLDPLPLHRRQRQQ